MSKRRFFSGNTMSSALMAAAREFGIKPEEVKYEPVEKRHGFVNSRKRFLIEVNADDPRLETPADPRPLESSRVMPPPLNAGSPEKDEPQDEVSQADDDESHADDESSDWDSPTEADDLEEESDPEEASENQEEGRRGRGRRRGGRGRRGRGSSQSGSSKSGSSGSADSSNDRGSSSKDKGQKQAPKSSGRDRDRDRKGGKGRGGHGGRRGGQPRRRYRDEPESQSELAELARQALDCLLDLMRIDAWGKVYQNSERIEIDLEGRDTKMLLRHYGKGLFAMEHLMPKMIRSLGGELVPVRVDSDGFHEMREQELGDLAERTAQQVVRKRKAVTLDWLNPAERRIVHMALADHPDVYTESLGKGYLKRLSIRPNSQKDDDDDERQESRGSKRGRRRSQRSRGVQEGRERDELRDDESDFDDSEDTLEDDRVYDNDEYEEDHLEEDDVDDDDDEYDDDDDDEYDDDDDDDDYDDDDEYDDDDFEDDDDARFT